MARQARELSDSGFMHVIMRGTGRQLLFEGEEDYTFYLASLERYPITISTTNLIAINC